MRIENAPKENNNTHTHTREEEHGFDETNVEMTNVISER
jgi:hypothetical protein